MPQSDYNGHIMRSGQKMVVGIRDAKARFSNLVSRVKNGATVEITDRGKKVAQIIPFPSEKLDLDQKLRLLEEKGLISLAKFRGSKKINPIVLPKNISLQKILQQDRNRY